MKKNEVFKSGYYQKACSRIIDSMESGVYAADNKGQISFANQSLARIFNYTGIQDILGTNLAGNLYENPDDREVFLKILKENGHVCDYEIKMVRKDGSKIIVSVRSNVLNDENGNIEGVEGVLDDITEERVKNKYIPEVKSKGSIDTFDHFLYDPLTQLNSYQFFLKLLELELEKVNSTLNPLYMIMIDIDSFHLYNNKFGKDSGDELLKELAVVFKSSFRKTDILCRQSQDQFLVVLPDTKHDEALGLAKHVKEIVRKNSFKKKITCSMGISRYIPGMTQQELFLKANIGLCMAKEVGKNEACLYG